MDDERKVYDGGGECVPTITGDHADRVTDFCPVVLDLQGGKTGARIEADGACPTLTRGTRSASDVHAICFEPGIARREGGGNTIPDVLCVHGSQDPVVPDGTANAVGRNNGLENCVALSVDCYNQTVKDGAEQTVRAKSADSDHIPYVCEKRSRYAVRRLMPVETERLFGLPDGYTIPAGLEITDELVDEFVGVFQQWNEIESGGRPVKPKTRKWVRQWLEKVSNSETCPDAPRYKACGNSFGCNCVRWIGLGIQAVQDEIDAEERK